MHPKQILFLIFFIIMAQPAHADQQDCSTAGSQYDDQINALKTKITSLDPNDPGLPSYRQSLASLTTSQINAPSECQKQNLADQNQQAAISRRQQACATKASQYPGVYQWDDSRQTCINKADQAAQRNYSNDDDCGSASMFAGDLKGENCKKALETVRDVQDRNSSLSDATNAAAGAYGNYQATSATGAQSDAQTRQANVMKTLAIAKFATGALSLSGAMQLKAAASGAEDANSTITGAMQNIQGACGNDPDEEACFYSKAPQFGVPADQRTYASYSNMKQGAQQSQDQADQANSVAKDSVISGASDLLIGMQAMQAANMANNNAQNFAPPPMMARAPASVVNLGGGASSPGVPGVQQAPSGGPAMSGNPTGMAAPFGAMHHGVINGAMAAGKPGTMEAFKPAMSGVSGGGGGGGGAGGGGLHLPPSPRRAASPKNTSSGEFNLAGGGPKNGNGAGAPAEKGNSLADLLGGLFPPGQDGKPVVDTRQIASAAGANVVGDEQGEESSVTASDLTIFEQIKSKYQELTNSGRI